MKEKEKLHPLMLAGTGSDVGKSLLATAFCRIFAQDGYHPAPFKAQNMALNSYATPEGLEIGRAQAVQAAAAGVPCHTDMNPLLLKPTDDCTSQVILNGKPAGNQGASDYYRNDEGRIHLKKAVQSAFDRLKARYNPIVMEGAGSIAEINLRQSDLVNLSMAQYADASVILVADIDRGGVFASLYGTIMLLSPQERSLIKGLLINKFRGDLSLFASGRKMIEDLCHIPVVGVVPYLSGLHIEAEDSVALEGKSHKAVEEKINIAVVQTSHLSNFTDFDLLEQDSRVHLYYTAQAAQLSQAQIILLPGSKNTIADLDELHKSGAAQAVKEAAHTGATVMGICGGYQMMGLSIADPLHIEGEQEEIEGLGLLPVVTTIEREKITRQVAFTFLHDPHPCQGYEIHMGTTCVTTGSPASPLNHLATGGEEGYILNDRCMGTYLHGILDNPFVIEWLLSPWSCGGSKTPVLSHSALQQQQYNRLAAHVREYVDIPYIYHILQ